MGTSRNTYTIKEAAEILGTSQQAVRIFIEERDGVIGTAFRHKGSSRTKFIISKVKLDAYVSGKDALKVIYARIEELRDDIDHLELMVEEIKRASNESGC